VNKEMQKILIRVIKEVTVNPMYINNIIKSERNTLILYCTPAHAKDLYISATCIMPNTQRNNNSVTEKNRVEDYFHK